MSEFRVVEEAPVTLTELKEALLSLEEEMPLSFRGEKTKEYLANFVNHDSKDIQKFTQQLEDLNIPRFKPRHIVKVLDVMPQDMDSLRLLFSNETITIKEEDLKKILDVIPQ